MIVGTAGHIDHGKTALVRALTGVDADRLAEEKARGITIELGFAYSDLGTGAITGFVIYIVFTAAALVLAKTPDVRAPWIFGSSAFLAKVFYLAFYSVSCYLTVFSLSNRAQSNKI